MSGSVVIAIANPRVAAGIVDELREDARYDVIAAPTPGEAAAIAEERQADLLLADPESARGIPGALSARVVVATTGDTDLALAVAREIGAAGWVKANDVAELLPQLLRRVRAAASAQARTEVGIPARAWALTFAAAAVLFRALYLLAGTDDPGFTGWYNDSYHHWQISYLSKEIGFFRGPRLWDLGGMEYFWGFIPTILGALFLAVTFTTALWPLQLLNVAAGSATVAVLYLVGRRYWSHRVGLLIALFFAVNPVSVFVDTSGMQEPVALLFLSLALLWFLDHPFRAGLMLGLAAASRPDYWVYSLAILASATFIVGRARKRTAFLDFRAIAPYLLGWAVPMTPYVLHLWIQTGNPLYPLYWNFLGNARGEWLLDVQPTPAQQLGQAVARVLLVAAIAGHVLVLRRRPQGWPVLVAGLWGVTLVGVMLGLSKYVLAYLERFWIDRIMLLLYLLAAVLVAVGVVALERRLRLERFMTGTALGLLVVLGLNALWLPTITYREQIRTWYATERAFGEKVAAIADEGTVLVPGAAVHLTYVLVQRGLGSDRLLSNVYHPDYRPGAPQEFLAWLRKHDARWLVIDRKDAFYRQVIAEERGRFVEVAAGGAFQLFRVTP